MSEFTLNTSKDNVFLIGLSEIEQRLDAEFYLEDFDFTDFIKLRNIAKVKGGKRLPKGFYYSDEETDFLYLQVSNLDSDNEINWKTAKYISKEVFEILERYETVEGDLVFSIAGSIGKINVVKNIPEGKKVILTENASKIHFKKDVQVIPEFIELVLKTPLLQKQINLNYIQTTIPKIGLDRIENLFIPVLPSIEKQNKCLDFFKSAFESKLEKKREAKELLASIDDYLLAELGIVIPKQNNTLENRIFTTSLSEISGDRIDPFFNNPSYHELLNTLHNHPKFNTYIKFITKGETPLWRGDDYVEEGVPFLQVNNLSVDGINSDYKLIPEEVHNRMKRSQLFGGEVLYSMAGTIGIATINNLTQEANINQAIAKIIVDEDKIHKSYLVEYLNSRIGRVQAERYLTVSSQPNINFGQIKGLRIISPPKNKQLEIVDNIQTIRLKSSELEDSANASILNAKEEIEKMILGE